MDALTSAVSLLLRARGAAKARRRQVLRGDAADFDALARRCKAIGYDLRRAIVDWDGFSGLALPVAAGFGAGHARVVLGVESDTVVLAADDGDVARLSHADFLRAWSGQVYFLAPRPSGRVPMRLRRRPLAGAFARAGAGIAGIAGRVGRFALRALRLDRQGTDAFANHAGRAPNAHDETALLALVMLLRFHGHGVEPEQIRHRLGSPTIGVAEMLRCAKELGLRAQVKRTAWDRLAQTPLPGIACLRDGGFLILGKIDADAAMVQRPGSTQPELLTRDQFLEIWDTRLVLMTRRVGLTDLGRRFDIGWFLGAMHKYRRLLVEVLVASFFLQLFALVSPLIFQVVIDKVLVHHSMSTLDVLVAGLVIISLFETVIGGLRTYLFAHTTNRIDVELGARLFRHLLALPIAYFQARRVGDSVARVREVENIRQFLTSSALTIVIDLFFTFVFLAVMIYYSPLLTLVVVASFPFYIAISAGATPVFRRLLNEKFRRGSENQGFLVESVTGVETLKSMAVEPRMQRRWEEQLAGYVTAGFKVLNLNNNASQAVQLVNKLVTAATLYFGARLVIDDQLTVGELVAFNMLSGRVSQPVLRLAQIWQDFHQTRVSIERLGDILNTAPEPSSSSARAALPPIRGHVALEHVTFRYRIDAPAVLHDVSLTVSPGQVVGIVGASGSGKSTLTKLIQRLFIPESGRVMVDGVDLTMVDVAWLRRQIGVVLQDNILFNQSIRENIALADPAIAMELVIEAAKLAGAHEFILELPEGYDTVIGERGTGLSGGQRQRIAIARALITNPRILIFDEATSSLDYESERAIQQNMKRIAAGRTVFIIAHRLSTVRQTDRIITVERGRIVEDGRHDDLIRMNGRYAKLHRMQGGGE